MGHEAPDADPDGVGGEPSADALRQAAGMYEWLLKEERRRTTTMTLANDNKRRKIRILLTQRDALLAALRAIYEATEPDTAVREPLAHIVERIAQEAIEAAS